MVCWIFLSSRGITPKQTKKKSTGNVAGATRRSSRPARNLAPSVVEGDASGVVNPTPGHAGGSASTNNGEFGTMGAPWPLINPPDSRVDAFLSPQLLSPSAPPPPPNQGLPVGSDFFPSQPAMLSCVCDELGGEVPSSVRDRIWKGEFIELGILLKRDSALDDSGLQSFSLCSAGSAVLLRPQSKAPAIANIEQWTSAFLIFASIYLERHTMRARELLKYMDIVRSIVRFGAYNWRSYDTQFRLRQARHPQRSWAVIDTELWLTVAASPSQAGFAAHTRSQPFRPYDRTPRRGNFPASVQYSRQGAVRGAGPNSPRSPPVCFAFNAGSCTRPSCRYAHKCRNCAATAHGSNACNANANGKQKPGSNTN